MSDRQRFQREAAKMSADPYYASMVASGWRYDAANNGWRRLVDGVGLWISWEQAQADYRAKKAARSE